MFTILGCMNSMSLGGAQLITLDTLTDIRARGHRVVLVGPPGVLVDSVAERGLEWIEGPASLNEVSRRTGRPREPSPDMVRAIHRIVAREHIDIIHACEWVRSLEALFGAHLVHGTPMVSSVLSISLPKFIPRSSHLVVGAADMADTARARGYRHVTLIEPPTWTPPAPAPDDVAKFRAANGLTDELPLVLIASRLANEKVESVEMAIDAVASMNDRCPVQLVVAGEGAAEHDLRARGDAINARLGRRAVVFTGLLLDILPAYAAADVVVGMGTSVRRGMAMAKPAVLIGQQGFAQLMDEEHGPAIAAAGFWGLGTEYGASDHLADQLRDALSSPARTAELSAYALALEAGRPTRTSAADDLERVYQTVVGQPPNVLTRSAAAARSSSRFGAMRARAWTRRKLRRDVRA